MLVQKVSITAVELRATLVRVARGDLDPFVLADIWIQSGMINNCDIHSLTAALVWLRNTKDVNAAMRGISQWLKFS